MEGTGYVHAGTCPKDAACSTPHACSCAGPAVLPLLTFWMRASPLLKVERLVGEVRKLLTTPAEPTVPMEMDVAASPVMLKNTSGAIPPATFSMAFRPLEG